MLIYWDLTIKLLKEKQGSKGLGQQDRAQTG